MLIIIIETSETIKKLNGTILNKNNYRYVDNTGDVQTASIMVIIGKCLESTSSDHLDGMEASINDTDLRTTIVDQAHFSYVP